MSTDKPESKFQYPVPIAQRRPVPAYARAWGPKVDYPAPGLVTPELAQNIAIDSIFVNFTPSPTPTSTTYIRELIIPDKCEECRLRAKGCDRARPLCGRCRKIGKNCVPVSSGFARLRKGRGGKAVGYGRIWTQAEDPEEVEREEKEREKKEKEVKFKEVMNKEPPPTQAGPSGDLAGGVPMASASVAPMGTMTTTVANKKRKRTISMAMASSQALATSLPPSKGHYIDYSSFDHTYANLASTSVQSTPASIPIQKQDPNNIPIDPQLLELSVDIPQTPGPKRAKTSSSSLSLSTGPSTDTSAGSSTSLSMSSHQSRSSLSYPFPSPSTPYSLANLSISTPVSSAPPSVTAEVLSPVEREESMTPIEDISPADSPPVEEGETGESAVPTVTLVSSVPV